MLLQLYIRCILILNILLNIYVVRVLLINWPKLIEHPPQHFIALAAIGTIADLVSLTDENRYIVKQGLKILNNHTPSSIKAILNQAGFNDEITEETIGFIIGPRLNAVGRLEDALAAELLLSDEFEEAEF